MPTASPLGTPLPPATTGINRWWTYEEKPLAGVGKAMINVGTGNLIVQSDDLDVPERGIDLAFRRTYNSQSNHDASSTDGATPALFGNGWTNTFDAHLGFNAATNTLSVYDIDGARYDYTAQNGQWVAPPGMAGTSLTSDGGDGYYWGKKTGTIYYFWAPFDVAGLNATNRGYEGRLYRIYARNHNNYVQFTYAWSGGDASAAQNVTQIVAQHVDGDKLTLSFAKFGGFDELASMTRPDGQQITYNYDSNGNLLTATRPGNAVDDATRSQTITSLTDRYWYYSGTHVLQCVGGPRFNSSNGADGSNYTFTYDTVATSGKLSGFNEYGLMSFTPNDGVGQAIQGPPAAGGSWTGNTLFRQTQFAYGANTTNENDTQGHYTQWAWDARERVTKTWESQGSYNLVTQATWEDANNDITASVDARGNETDYGYDANGNTLYVQQPQITTNLGTGRPTARYAYDQYNNVIAYCDPQYVWTNGTSQCQAVSGATRYGYDYSDAQEPFGKLTDTFSPLGYHHHITYDSNDFGLPIAVTGDSISQADNTTRTPSQTFGYDGFGDLTGFNKGNGAWSITYDAMHRPLTHTDPDGVTSFTCYNVDGSVAFTETAAQHALDANWTACPATAPQFAMSQKYDADGNVLVAYSQYARTATNASATPAGETDKWYDGEDRLVEVKQPYDTSYDAYGFPWLTRYIYDLSNNSTVSITGGAQNFNAYGNLYKTQECLTGSQVTLPMTAKPSTCSFFDVRGNTFDALDRAPAKYEVGVGSTAETSITFDANGNYGLPAIKTNAAGQTDTLTYDATAHLTNDTFNDATPSRTYTYDPDGRVISQYSPAFGTKTMTYDAEGRLTATQEPASLPDPGTITYAYYGDGTRKSLSLSIPALSYNQLNLFQYSYRADGERSGLLIAGSAGGNFSWSYSNGGRMQTESDPLTGQVADSNTGSKFLPRKFTYDAYGRVASFEVPDGYSTGSFAYDAAGEVLSYVATDPYNNLTTNAATGYSYVQSPSTVYHWYTARGELYNSTGPLMQTTQFVSAPSGFADGVQCAASQGNTCTFNALSGSILSSVVTQQSTETYSYDLVGRESTDAKNPGTTCTRTFDADNRTTSSANCTVAGPDGDVVSNSYIWGPDGHLGTAGQAGHAGVTSYHWDGDELLYQTDTAGLGVQLFIEKLGHIDGPQTGTPYLTVDDRDWTGTTVQKHSATGSSNFTVTGQQPYYQYYGSFGKQGVPKPVGWPGTATGLSATQPVGYVNIALTELRDDGYFDGINAFQGVRAYDPDANQWTTPDAYSGAVDDPMSQHPYIWNNNSGLAYSDPSGFCADGRDAGCMGGVDWNLVAKYGDIMDSIVHAIAIPWPGEGSALGAIEASQFARSASSLAVIGRNPAYETMAIRLNARSFSLLNFSSLTNMQIKALNLEFLKNAMKDGVPFMIVGKAEAGSWLQWEVNEIMRSGEYVERGNWLVPKNFEPPWLQPRNSVPMGPTPNGTSGGGVGSEL